MNKKIMIVAVAAVAGYFLASKLSAYQPFTFAYATGAKL